MKTAIKTSALFLGFALLSTGVFAAKKPVKAPVTTNQNMVLFTSLSNCLGVQVIVHKATPSASSVKIYNANGDLILSDYLSKKEAVSLKGYDMSELANGDYIFQVKSNNTTTNRKVHVYNDEHNEKAFFFEM